MMKKVLEAEVTKFVDNILALENSRKVILLKKCQGCGSPNLYKFINFGPMPKPNIYQTREEVFEHGQISYQLDANLCTSCGLVQLGEIVPSDELFAENYAYRTPD